MIQRKRRDFKKGGRGLAPPIVLGGQPSALLALPKGRYFLLFTLPLLTSLCPAFYSYIFVTMFLSYWVFIFQLPSFQDFPPVAFYQGWLSLNLIRWVFNAEKPGAFPQEKTDTSYPRASLGSCPWQLLLTTAPHGSNRACSGLRWCRSPTRLSKSHTGPHRGEFVFPPQNEFTPPPKGGGAGYRLLFSSFGFFTQRSPVLFRRKRRILRIRGLL